MLRKQNAHIHGYTKFGLHMTMVNTSMLTVVPGTPLYRAMEKGLSCGMQDPGAKRRAACIYPQVYGGQ